MDTSLGGKKALVCGSTQGIGLAIARQLAEQHAAVILLARRREALESVRDSLPSEMGQGHALICADFDDPHAFKQALSESHRLLDGLNILVGNFGGPPAGPLLDADVEALIRAFSTHVVCSHLLVQATVASMKASGYGRVINITSTSAKQPIEGLGISNTVRAAVVNWAKTLATELGPFGITVNNVLPGLTETARLRDLIELKARKTGRSEQAIRREWEMDVPLGRIAAPAEIANVVGFLASPAASYVNGINVPVDGGRTRSL